MKHNKTYPTLIYKIRWQRYKKKCTVGKKSFYPRKISSHSSNVLAAISRMRLGLKLNTPRK